MAVYIPNMKMPENCAVCQFRALSGCILLDGIQQIEATNIIGTYTRYSGCPLRDYPHSAKEEEKDSSKVETCRERLKREYPRRVTSDGWCDGCPPRYGYLPANIPCMYRNNGSADCRACWSRPVEEVKTDETR